MRKLVLLSMLAACSLPAVAHAADPRAAIRAACQSDVKTNCGMLFSRSKALACLISNAPKLSAGCTAALKKASCNAKAPGNVKAAFPCAG